MKTQDSLNLQGRVKATVKKANGEVQVIEHHNLVTSAGAQRFMQRFFDNTYGLPNTIAVGTGTAAPTRNDTTLGIQTAVSNITSTNVSGATVEYQARFPLNTIVTLGSPSVMLTELGLFTTDGVLFAKSLFDVVGGIEICEYDELTIAWLITVSGF